MKILLVEDNFLNRKVMQSHIREHHGVDCDIATDGLEGLESIKKSMEIKEQYDIIFLALRYF